MATKASPRTTSSSSVRSTSGATGSAPAAESAGAGARSANWSHATSCPEGRRGGGVREREPHGEKHFGSRRRGRRRRKIERQLFGLPGRSIERGQRAASDDLAVGLDDVAAGEVRQIAEGAPVFHRYASGGEILEIHRAGPHRGVDLFDLEGVGVGLAVGRNQSVREEVAVVSEPRRAEVAAVGPVGAPHLVAGAERLVDEVPDEPALKRIVALDDLPVAGEAAHAVAHRVGVFHENERAHRALRRAALGVVLEPVGTHVHRGHDVHVRPLPGALVENRPRRIGGPDPVGGAVEDEPVAGLVSERPDDDRRVVAVALDHSPGAVEMRFEPLRPPGERDAGLVTHPVGLDVRFVHHVEAVLVGQLVEPGNVGVVGRADGVDVQLLHPPDVFEHQILVYHVPLFGMVFVPIHAPQHQRTAVHREPGAAYLDPPEPDPHRRGLDGCAAFVLDAQGESIDRRGLRGPRPHPGNRLGERDLGLAPRIHRGLDDARRVPHRISVGIAQLRDEAPPRSGFGIEVPKRRLEPETSVFEPVVEVGGDVKVAKVRRRTREQAHAAVDPADPPEILAFEVTAVAPAIDLHRDQVDPGNEGFGDPELSRRAASLRIADALPVHEHPKRRVDAVEADEHFEAVPVPGKFEADPVGADRVVVERHAGRIGGKRVGLVAVDRVPVTLQLPVGGNRNVGPVGVVERWIEEVRRALGGVLRPVESPRAVEAQPPPRRVGSAGGRAPGVGEGGEAGPGRLAVDREDSRVGPRGRFRVGNLPGGGERCERERESGGGDRRRSR